MSYYLAASEYMDPRSRIITVKLVPDLLTGHKPEDFKYIFVPYIDSKSPEKKMVNISGIVRPVYRLPCMIDSVVFIWASINSKKLKHLYSGNKERLDIYIQGHALDRIYERLDAAGKQFVNLTIYGTMLERMEVLVKDDYCNSYKNERCESWLLLLKSYRR